MSTSFTCRTSPGSWSRSSGNLGCGLGQIYNVAGQEVTSVLGCIELMARAVGVRPDVVHVPLDVAKRAHHPLVHWGEAIVGGAIISIEKALGKYL